MFLWWWGWCPLPCHSLVLIHSTQVLQWGLTHWETLVHVPCGFIINPHGTLRTCWCISLEIAKSGKQVPLKIIGKEFPKNCYKTIFRKINTEEIFFQLTLITNKDYFSRKKLKLRKFTVAVYVIYIYGRDVTHWCQLWMFVNIVSKYCLFIS